MEESQEAAELPAKKARHDPEVSQEEDARGTVAHNNRADVLGSEVTTYRPSSAVRLDSVPGNQERSNQHISSGCDSDRSYTKVETCKELAATESEYTSHIYQGNNPAVTTYDSQVAFSSLGQSAAYSTFSQTGQTYGLPPFGLSQPGALLHTTLPLVLSLHLKHQSLHTQLPFAFTFPLTSASSHSLFSAFSFLCTCVLFLLHASTHTRVAVGAMWPGIKSEPRLQDVPAAGQTPFLSFSTAYTSTQPCQTHYSYPSQGSCFTTSSVYSNIPTAPAVTTATATHQEFSSYNSLGQNQFSQYYVPPNSYLPPAPPSSEADGDDVSVPPYTPVKTETSASTGLPSSTAASPASVTLPPGAAQDEAARRNAPPKAKGKGKKSDSGQSTDNDLERVFLWDLDETIIIFHSLLTGSFAQKFGKDPATVLNLGLQMEELIFELADTHLFFNDLEECDQVHVEDVSSDDNGQDLSNYNFSNDGFSGTGGAGGQSSNPAVQGGVDWMRKLAFRYRRLKEIYNGYKGNVGALLSPLKRELLLRVRSDIETVTDSWLSTAVKSLLLIQSRGRCMNVLVTTTQLVPALAKVLLYGLGDVFPVNNIYSATKIGKESCFERIVSRFGKKVTYVVIGDGREEEFAAKQHNMPFWRISTLGDLVSLHQALELDFL
ncbi:eyes absent homolog 3 isoform X1 [Ictalurus furcatus]|uniref:eyes absent homolog 3 isoform X1 n=1 Tax=Ictalurus furcatus TaxID=66913 RepID=UPI002350D171|nr:eyes absent homolog 3 isoform X1 [Ictalurus furcatus]XP_053493990.1 eyes absent homolog 3 isoform X1 [Ictalurus furcatus]